MLTRRNFLGLLGTIPTAVSAARARDRRQLFSAIDDAFPNIINVSDFGIRGDGKTDNTSALFKLRRHLMARPEVGYTLVFPNGRYHYQDGFWLRGVRAYRLLGNGSVFCNIRPDRYHPQHRTLVLNPGMFTDLNKLPHGTEEHYTSQCGDLIADAAAGVSTIELRDTPPAGRYVPGMPVLVHGFNMMLGGYPPSPKFFEWKEVKSVRGRRITLTSPLRHDYLKDWPGQTDESSSYGPARLSPLRSSAFSLCDLAVIEDVVLERHDGAPSTFNTTGARHVIARNVHVDIFWPSQSEYVHMKNCLVGSMEIDKIVNRLEVEGGTYGELIEGISCESASFRGSRFTGAVSARPFNTVYEDCDFEGVCGMYQTTAMLLNPNRNGVSLAVRRCRFAPSDVSWVDGRRVAIDMVGPAEWTLEAVAVQGGNEVVVADHRFDSSAFLRPGLPFFIWSKEGRGIVRSIRAASIPEHLILTVSTTGVPPVAGDRLAFPTIERVTIEDCKTQLPGNSPLRIFRHNQPFAWNMHATTVFRTSIPVAGSQSGHEFIFGWVSRLEFDVRKPYTGPEDGAYLYVDEMGGTKPQQHRINLRKIGLRTNSIEGGLQGTQQDDQAPAWAAIQWLGYYWSMLNDEGQRLRGTPDEMPVVDLRLTREPFPMN